MKIKILIFIIIWFVSFFNFSYADTSEKGMTQSYGVMANYLYDLDVVEENHEIFFKNKVVPVSSEIESLKKKHKV